MMRPQVTGRMRFEPFSGCRRSRAGHRPVASAYGGAPAGDLEHAHGKRRFAGRGGGTVPDLARAIPLSPRGKDASELEAPPLHLAVALVIAVSGDCTHQDAFSAPKMPARRERPTEGPEGCGH
jgi:hypothetical protein